jgi:hypothetical protein
MTRSRFFPTVALKEYQFESEECKPTEDKAPTLAKITVTVPAPHTSSFGLQLQFKDKFKAGAVHGILPELMFEDETSTLVLTFVIVKCFEKSADLLFRETIAQLDQLTLRDKDALRIDYERCLDAHHIVSDYAKNSSHQHFHGHQADRSLAH